MERHSFRIKGMCCGDEVGLLKSEVAPLVGGAERLSFDLLRSSMIVSGSLDAQMVETIREAVAKSRHGGRAGGGRLRVGRVRIGRRARLEKA